MFGISFFELLIVILAAIIIINPNDYSKCFNFLNKLYNELKKAYLSALDEFEKLKQESGFSSEAKKIKSDIENLDDDLKKIIGDDGKQYDAYDVKKIIKDNEK